MDYVKDFTVGAVAVTQWMPLKLDGSGNVVPMTTSTEKMIGVATKSAAVGEQVGVQVCGVMTCIVDGTSAIAVGADLMGGAGELVVYASTTGRRKVAKALEAASDTRQIRVLYYADEQAAQA